MDKDPDVSGKEINDPEGNFLKLMADKSVSKRLTFNEILTLLVSVGVLIISALTYLNAINTNDLKAAVRSLAGLAAETKRSADASNGQITQMKRQADAESGQLSAMHDQVTALRDQLAESRSQTKALSKQAGNSQISAKALQGQLNEMIEQRRPFIVVNSAKMYGPDVFSGDRPVIVVNLIINATVIGQGFASKINVTGQLFGPDGQNLLIPQQKICDAEISRNISISSDDKGSWFSQFTAYPGQSIDLPLNIVMGADQLSALRARGFHRVSMAVVGCIKYADDRGKWHRTSFIYDTDRSSVIDLYKSSPEGEMMLRGDIQGNGPAD